MNRVLVQDHECKGCGICISMCPSVCLRLSGKLNNQGYEYVEFFNEGACTGCGLCFLSCPEISALSVWKHKEAL
ncbi:MAG: 4Fe-4S dicluster domain-containing protein [Sphaerochaetaceae bacterium]